MAVSLIDQVASVKREIGFREKCYPRWVLEKKMSQAKSDHEIGCMKAVLAEIEGMRGGEDRDS